MPSRSGCRCGAALLFDFDFVAHNHRQTPRTRPVSVCPSPSPRLHRPSTCPKTPAISCSSWYSAPSRDPTHWTFAFPPVLSRTPSHSVQQFKHLPFGIGIIIHYEQTRCSAATHTVGGDIMVGRDIGGWKVTMILVEEGHSYTSGGRSCTMHTDECGRQDICA